MKAWLNLRHNVSERADAFTAGLRANGYTVFYGLPTRIDRGDLLVSWNRIGNADGVARQIIQASGKVLITENSSWGNDFLGKEWYTISRNWHNLAGCFPIGSKERWDSLGVELSPWRKEGETVILPQRGIGPACIAMPRGWGQNMIGRVRRHPGKGYAIPLEEDLARAGRVVTWGSGAAIKALMWGIRVESHMPNWIGEQDNTDKGRLSMFRKLAWAQFTIDEIRSGIPFERLLADADQV